MFGPFVLLALAVPPPGGARVQITITPERLELVPVLEERLQSRDLPFSIRHVDERRATEVLDAPTASAELLLHVWIDLHASGEARLVFGHPTRGRFAIRRVDLPRGLDEVARESIGLVLGAAVDALIEGTTFELTRAEAARALGAEPPPAPPLITSAPDMPRWRLGALYGASVFAPGELAWLHGPGATVARRRGRGGLSAMAQYLLRAEVDRAPLSARLDTIALRAGGDWDGVCSRLCWRVGLHAGLDIVRVSPILAQPALATAGPARTIFSPMARPFTSVSVPAGPATVTVTALLDVDVLGVRLQVERPEGPRDALVPWRVRPGLTLEVAFP